MAPFITLEGGEGAGKSTQVKRLADRLKRGGKRVVVTREPGGSPKAEALREVILSGKAKPFGPLAETVLFAAARASHLDETIRPALDRGDWVISDRFIDSTRVYQGAQGAVDERVIGALERVVVGDTRPDLTIILDIPADVGLHRVAIRNKRPDRFENESLQFHMKLRDRFLAIAKAEPERCVVVDASQQAEFVSKAIWEAVAHRFRLS